MNFEFDLWGWYVGTSGQPGLRTTATAPENLSTSDAPGALRANWTGVAWVYAAYEVPPETEPPVEDPRIWWMDVGPFYDRFGPDAVAIASSDHGACKAVQTLTGVRKYIDLRDPRVATMIDMLIATAQPTAQPWAPGSGPMTPEKKAVILTTPTVEYERHIKGLEG
ncbi:MAG: hypothetical protein KKB95_09375 [Gammaproteobacteria bacterium]|nr:hypothetical protein [Gammaproteobacteria bacterium]MBU1505772.1 hypothetical protein [Gammaproteobacteria bacterium]MBU2119460.1 hypothetical protein [Gammaproteobacteria bacterium]MBU2172634.1 hypothetical protein [Gammaproteobacteria bacterium]MBU2202092.1 hypothetical protein [Gammaproteobacteria bacterium]